MNVYAVHFPLRQDTDIRFREKGRLRVCERETGRRREGGGERESERQRGGEGVR